FIVAEPGHANQEKMRGDEAKTRRSRDGNWSKKGEVVYRNKGYFGVKAKGFAATMQRAVRGKPLNIRQIMRNDRISVQRMPCERVYAVTKGVFKVGKVMVTAFCFNLHQMRTLKRKKVVD
ncbi:MAG: transposase, partial [Methanohalophilus sp. T328-1]